MITSLSAGALVYLKRRRNDLFSRPNHERRERVRVNIYINKKTFVFGITVLYARKFHLTATTSVEDLADVVKSPIVICVDSLKSYE